MIKKEPQFNWKSPIGCLFFGLSYIVLLVTIQIARLGSTGYTLSVLTTTFKIMLNLFYGALIFSLAFLIIKFLKWLAWSTTTPSWKKKQMRNDYGK